LGRAATSRADLESLQRVSNDAPSWHLRPIYSADGTDAPAAVERGATPHMAMFHHGYMCVKNGHHDRALFLLRKAISIKPDFAEAHYNLGVAHSERGEFTEATTPFHNAINIKPDFAEAHSGLGVSLGGSDQLPEAVTAFNAAIAIRPDFAEAHYNLGVSFFKTNRHSEAIAAFNTAIAIKANYVAAHINLGVTLHRIGRLSEATEAYKTAISITGGDFAAYSNLSIALTQSGNFSEAITAGRMAVNSKPYSAESYTGLGIALAETGQVSEAITAFRRAIHINSEDALAHSNLAFSLARINQMSEAIAAQRTAIKIKPDDADGHYNLGIFLARIGRYSEAILALRAAEKYEKSSDLRKEISEIIEEYVGYADKERQNKANNINQLVSNEAGYTDYNEGEDFPSTRTRDLSGSSARSAEKEFKLMPDAGPTKQEILQLTDEQLARAFAQRTGTSVEDANTIVKAVRINAPTIIAIAQAAMEAARETTARGEPKPDARTAVAPATKPLSALGQLSTRQAAVDASTSSSPTVAALFGDVSAFHTKAHTRRNLPDDVTNDPEVVAAAKMIVNSHRYTPIGTLEPEAAERLRKARSIVRKQERRPKHEGANPT
jgi:tetratricopeptide (TPR) repeat protein